MKIICIINDLDNNCWGPYKKNLLWLQGSLKDFKTTFSHSWFINNIKVFGWKSRGISLVAHGASTVTVLGSEQGSDLPVHLCNHFRPLHVTSTSAWWMSGHAVLFNTVVHYSPAWERCCCKHEKLCAKKTRVLGITWLSIELTAIRDGTRKWMTRSEKGLLWDELTFERVPFSSTKRGALFFSGGGSDSLLHRQQKRLWKRPLLRGFFEGGTWEAPGTEQERRNI